MINGKIVNGELCGLPGCKDVCFVIKVVTFNITY